MRTERVSTHDLMEGDTIRHYDATLKLSNRKEYPMRAGDNPVTQGIVVTFDVELIGDDPGSIPMHWLTGHPANRYHVQGNRLGMWDRIITD